MKHSKKKYMSKALLRVQIVCIVVCIIAACTLGYYLYDYYKGQKTYQDLKKEVAEEKEDGTFTMDWDALQAVNSDVVVWIRTNNG